MKMEKENKNLIPSDVCFSVFSYELTERSRNYEVVQMSWKYVEI